MTLARPPRRLIVDVLLLLAITGTDLFVWGGDRQLRLGGAAPMWLVPLLSVAVYSTVLLRRRYPLAIFGLQCGYGLIGLIIPGYEPFAGLLIALYAVARQADARTAKQCLIAAAGPLLVNSVDAGTGAQHSDSLGAFVANAAVWLLLTGGVWQFARRARRADEARVSEARLAVEQEQLRVARELHDIVAHAITIIVLQAAGTRVGLPTDAPEAVALRSIEASGVQAMTELHRLLGLLRRPDDQSPAAGLNQLPLLVTTTVAAGLDIKTTTKGTPVPLDPSGDHAAYRVIQEALTNAGKHGGRGTRVRVALEWSPAGLGITVTDEGGGRPGAPMPSSGHGLDGLAERVHAIGGEFSSGSAGTGFTVSATLPATRTIPAAGRTPVGASR